MFAKVTGIATNYPNSMSSVLGCCYEIEFIENVNRYRYELYSKNKQISRNQSNPVLTYVVSSCFFLPSMSFILLCCFALLC